MATPPPGQPVWLQTWPVPVFAMFHAAPDAPPATAVLICPPFGWEDMASYPSRRAWAEQLAAAGHATLRIDLPGAGDSGGSPADDDLLSAWSAAIAGAAAWLREAAGAPRVAAVGIGFGGLVAGHAVSAGADIDDLVLWGTPAKGRTFARGERAFSRLQTSRMGAGADEPSPLPDGWLESGGYVLSAATLAAVEALDLAQLPTGRLRRALLLERDGMKPDAGVHAHLEGAGVDVTVGPGAGYAQMMASPENSVAPAEVFARTAAWLGEETAQSPPAEHAVPASGEEVKLTVDGVEVRERPFSVELGFGRLFGILTEPFGPRAAPLCVVYLPAWAERRSGPNRLWVEGARRWAARGLVSLRVDLEGVGDSDGDRTWQGSAANVYDPRFVTQVRAIIDALEAEGLAARFVLAGLCSGGNWAFDAAAADPRVSAALVVNSEGLTADEEEHTLRSARKVTRALQPEYWRRIVRGEVKLRSVVAIARAAGAAARMRVTGGGGADESGDHPLDVLFDRLQAGGTRVIVACAEGEPFGEDLIRDGVPARMDRWPDIDLVTVAGRDHNVRPIVAQRDVHALLDRTLERELSAS